MKNALTSILLSVVLAGAAVASAPSEKFKLMNDAFLKGDIAGGSRLGHEILQSNDAGAIRDLATYVSNLHSEYAESLREPVMQKAAEMGISVVPEEECEPTEGAPWRLHAVALVGEYEDVSTANNAEGMRQLAMELYAGRGATRRFGIGLLYVAASMDDAIAKQQLAKMYRQGKDVQKDAASAAYFTDKETPSAMKEMFFHCIGQGGQPANVRERGVDFAEGRHGVEKNERTAIILYQAAADMGDATAARWMGWRYLQGRGVKKNRQMAEQCFTMAAIQGDPAARQALKTHFNKTVEPTQ